MQISFRAPTTDFIHLPDWRGTGLIVITTIILAYSVTFGMGSILLLYVLWFGHLFYKGQFALYPARDMVAPLVFSILCTLSFFWSDYPGESLYKGAEYISMILCTLIISRLVSLASFIKGLIIGCVIVLLSTLASGQYGSDSFGGDDALVGYFGSKNQVGLFAEIGIIATLFGFFLQPRKILHVLLYAAVFIVCMACLYLSKSSSSLLSLIAVIGVAGYALLLGRVPAKTRPVLLMLTLLGGVTFGVSAVAFDLEIYQKILGALGKDSTLTGRTYLWQEGIKAGWDRPLLGHGYSAFWVVGQPLAEQYWAEFFIDKKTGFHFHNMLIQTFVDMGFLGLACLIFMLIKSFFVGLYRCIADPDIRLSTLFFLAISAMFMVRVFVEVDFLGPFGIGVLLFFFVYTRLSQPRTHI